MDNYKAKNRGLVTSTKLRAFLQCQKLYELQYLKEISADDDAQHFILGRAFEDSLRMSSAEWEGHYFGLNRTERATVERARLEALRNKEIDAAGDYETGKVFHARYTAQNGREYKLKAELDRYNGERGLIRDYKFVRDVSKFQWHATDMYNYPFQIAFYQIVEAIATDRKGFAEARFDVVDKTKNAASCSFLMPEETMERSRASVIEALELYSKAEFAGVYRPVAADERLTKCAKCPMYRFCASAIQNSPEIFQ